MSLVFSRGQVFKIHFLHWFAYQLNCGLRDESLVSILLSCSFWSLTQVQSINSAKPTNGLLTDRLNFLTNNRRTSNRPIWLIKDWSKLINDWWQTLHESFSQYHHGLTEQSFSTDQTYNNIDWKTLFTWLWRWLPLRLSKRQSPTTVLFRTTLTRTITQYELLILLGSNHLL